MPKLKDHFIRERTEIVRARENRHLQRNETAFTIHEDTVVHKSTAAVITCIRPVQVQTSSTSAWMGERLRKLHPYERNYRQLMAAIGGTVNFPPAWGTPRSYRCLGDGPLGNTKWSQHFALFCQEHMEWRRKVVVSRSGRVEGREMGWIW